MFEQKAHVWSEVLDSDHVFLIANYHILETYVLRFPPNTDATLRVPKWLLVESVFNADLPDGGSGRPLLLRLEQKTVLLILHLT